MKDKSHHDILSQFYLIHSKMKSNKLFIPMIITIFIIIVQSIIIIYLISPKSHNDDNTCSVQVNNNSSKDTLTIKNSEHYDEEINISNRNVEIGGNAVINKDIILENGDLTIGNSVTVHGLISVKNGSVSIGGNGQYKKTIKIENGNFEAGNSNHFMTIEVIGGNLKIDSNNTINGDLTAETGFVKIWNSNNISGNISANKFEQGGNNVIEGTY